MGVSLFRHSAIDGKALVDQMDQEQLSVLTKLEISETPQRQEVMSWGHLACALSHQCIWDIVSKDQSDNVHIVMEDDIELSPDLLIRLGVY